jgi:hypothetical protein
MGARTKPSARVQDLPEQDVGTTLHVIRKIPTTSRKFLQRINGKPCIYYAENPVFFRRESIHRSTERHFRFDSGSLGEMKQAELGLTYTTEEEREARES